MNKQIIISILFSVIVFIVLIPTSCALNTLGGDVRDTGGVGISGATVTVIGYGSETTNSIGHYYFYDMPSGAYTVTASAPGYIDSSVGLYVIYSTYQDFTLSTVPPTPTPTMIPDPTPTPILDPLDDWGFGSDVTTGLPSFPDSTYVSPTVFYDGTIRKMIVGVQRGGTSFDLFYGYRWTGTTWVEDSSIVDGLPMVVMPTLSYFPSPTVFNEGGTLKLIVGHGCVAFGSTFTGYRWTGSTWIEDSSVVNGDILVGTPNQPSPCTFELFGDLKMIVGDVYGSFTGYQWVTDTWYDAPYISCDLPDVGYNAKPTVFYDNDVLKLISGDSNGSFRGFYYYGGYWFEDTQFITGLVDIGSASAPTVFHGSDFMLIAGTKDGEFVGFNSQFQATPTATPTVSPVIAIPPIVTPTETPIIIPIIEPPQDVLEVIFEEIMIFFSNPFNWLLLLFAYIGAFLGKIISNDNDNIKNDENIGDIIADTSLYGTIGWTLVLFINLFLPVLSMDEILVIVSFFLSGFVISILLISNRKK